MNDMNHNGKCRILTFLCAVLILAVCLPASVSASAMETDPDIAVEVNTDQEEKQSV